MERKQLGIESLESKWLLTVLPLLTLDPIEGGFSIDSGMAVDASFAAAGDINNDDLDDVLVVSEDSSGIRSSHVLFGSENISNELTTVSEQFSDNVGFRLPLLDGSTGFTIPSLGEIDPQTPFSQKSVGVGDINGDGIDDLAIAGFRPTGAPREFVTFAKLVFGSDQPFDAVLELNDASSEVVGLPISLLQNTASSGLSSGDVNGDGINDLVLGQDSTVHVVFGNPTLHQINVSDLDGSNGFTVSFDAPNDFSALTTGDVNDDGFDDVLVGAARGESGFIILGGDSGSIGTLEVSHPTPRQLSYIGDVNDDGFDDFAIVGSEHTVDIVLGRKEFSSVIQADFIVDGFDNDENDFAVRVAGPGDVNEDGVDDILLGNPNFDGRAGAIYVLFGRSDLKSTDVGNLLPQHGYGFLGFPRRQLGMSVHPLGDFDGDGINDMLVRPEDTFGDHTGLVVFGRPTPLFGDANHDRVVDFKDFLILAENFGSEEDVFFEDGDFDGDGRVSFLDFLVLAENFGKSL